MSSFRWFHAHSSPKSALSRLSPLGDRAMRHCFGEILLGAILVLSPTAHAQDAVAPEPAPAATSSPDAAAQAAPSAPASPPAEVKPTPPPPPEDEEEIAERQARPVNTRKSRLTRDESEYRADHRSVLLTVGEDKLIDLDFSYESAKGISVGNDKIVKFTLVKVGDQRQIMLKPVGTGETNVSLRDEAGNLKLIFDVRVTASSVDRAAADLKALLRDVEGIEIKVMGKRIVIDGEIIVPQDWGRLYGVLQDKVLSENVLNLAVLSPLALQILSRRIEEDVKVFAPQVRARSVNGQIWLEGTVDSEDKSKRCADIARRYLPPVLPASPLDKDASALRQEKPAGPIANYILIQTQPTTRTEKLIRLTMNFVELSKDYNKVFGFKWQPGFTADPQIAFATPSDAGAQAATTANFSATISALFPKLVSAQEAGFARVLRTATVVVRSGQEGKLTDGSSIPYGFAGANGQASQAVAKTGTAMSVTPQILGESEDIQMKIQISQNAFIGRTPAGAPMINEHTLQTDVFVKSNESAALAGLNSQDISTSFNKDDPQTGTFTGQTGSLFRLIRSKSYAKKKGQYVYFITPEIVENASDGTDDLKKNFRIKVK